MKVNSRHPERRDAAKKCRGGMRLPQSVWGNAHSKHFRGGIRSALRGVDMMDRISGQLERYMDLLSARQKLVASNIANADTPGYQTQDIDFHRSFRTRRLPDAENSGGGRIGHQKRRQQRQPGPRVAPAGGERAALSGGVGSAARANPARCVRPSRRVKAHESVFRPFGERIGHGGAARRAPNCWWKTWPTPKPPARPRAARIAARTRFSRAAPVASPFSSVFQHASGRLRHRRSCVGHRHRRAANRSAVICPDIRMRTKTAMWRFPR